MKLTQALRIIATVLLLTGCAQAPPDATTPDLTFANLPRLSVRVARIEVDDAYQPPFKAPNIEHALPMPLYTAVEDMLRQKLAAVGGGETLRVTVTEASVLQQILPGEKKLWDAVTRKPAERLKAKISLRLDLLDPAAENGVAGHADVTVRRIKTLPEGISPADRDRAYLALTEGLMSDLNGGLRTAIVQTLGR